MHTRFDDRAARALLGPAGITPTSTAEALGAALAYAERANWGRTPLARDAVTTTEGQVAA